MQKLIQDLLSFSRISTHGSEFKKIDSDRIVESAINHLQVSITETGAMIETGMLPIISADRLQMTQVFQNLIHNGLKFCNNQPPKILISAKKKNDQWCFSISDNGIGIEEEYKDKIFIIFQRLHTRNEYPGTGIGLAVCKKIIQRHGGDIWFTSEPGKGSVFYFSLPE